MDKVNKEQLSKLFGIKIFDLVDQQRKELNEQTNKFAQNNILSSGIAIHARIELFKKHLKELCEKRIESYFEILEEDLFINDKLKNDLVEDLQNYITSYIKSKNSSLNAAMLSSGQKSGSSIILAHASELSNSLGRVMSYAIDALHQKTNKHNFAYQKNKKKKFLEEYEELEMHQNVIISSIIEAHRSLPVEKRVEFFVTIDSGGTSMLHPSFLNGFQDVSIVDLKMMDSVGYIKIDSSNSPHVNFSFNPTMKGIKYYEFMKQNYVDSFQHVDSEVIDYLYSSNFPIKYQNAFAKWKEAENLLWKAENQINYSTIGHLCRESVQEFIDVLIIQYNLVEQYPDKTKTKTRFDGILGYNRDKIGKTVLKFLTAYNDYWYNLIDIIQRQEHSGLKEGEKLGFEDARRVVFHTAILFYEINKIIR
ncbi:MAG: hypothetical protein WC209_15740 [Ignavibacteriaceae bacterium]|jgi:hypothetical protein